MTHLRFWRLALTLFIVSLTLSACSFGGNQELADLGAVFVSTDNGAHFTHQPYIPSISGKPSSISNVNVRVLAIDPSDNLRVYLGTYGNGLYYTANVSEGWQRVKSFPGDVTVNEVVVNPQNKCELFAIFANQLLHSADCARSWKQLYLDADAKVTFNTLAIDPRNPANLYLGTSNGDILKSIDSGVSWRVIKRLDKAVAKIVLLPSDSRQIFVADINAGFYSFITNSVTNPRNSADINANFSVQNWSDFREVLTELGVDSAFKSLKVGASDGLVLLATKNIVIKSPDKGVSWQKLDLLPSEKQDLIEAIAIDPQNSNNIYYGTQFTFARSTDGGVTWSNIKLPTKRAVSEILIDYRYPNTLYLGVNSGPGTGLILK
ncbi:MAG: hypothetical protein WCX09_02320 [Patescibacteria group bacterium]|jgi:photosystem II stability/assembly factor-like uncharacterized protein